MQEKSADEDYRIEIAHDPGADCLHKLDHDGGPALHGNRLEYLHHGEDHVVEVGRAV